MAVLAQENYPPGPSNAIAIKDFINPICPEFPWCVKIYG